MAEKQVIPIYSLSGGVSRQPPSKRTPFQAENLDNCLVTLERSVEKRPGFSLLKGVGTYDLSFLPVTADPHFTWYQLDRENRYLIILDRSATGPTSNLIYVLKITETEWYNVTPAQQWDPTDLALTWSGIDTLLENDVRYPIYLQSLKRPEETDLLRYNAVLALGMVNKDTRTYMTFGTKKTREMIKSLQIGTNIIYLNTKVYAGFTSGTSGKSVNLDGSETETIDTIGSEVTYFSAVRVKKLTDGRMYPETYALREGEEFDASWGTKFIPVEDYVYGDFEKPWLGQSVENFGDLLFPPDNDDWVSNNSNTGIIPSDETARNMLRILYDPDSPYYTPSTNPADGRGKIYYCDAPYLSLDAGYYRVISFPEGESYSGTTGKGKPYTQKVRTPDYCSVIDKKRMPQRLTFLNNKFSFQPIEWAERTVGDRLSNPGPSPFMNEEMEARHVQISSITNYRDRLFFSSGDVVFSSQLGVLEDLWIKDPSNITISDPIDVRAGSNNFSEITAMIPFNAYLFINTKGGVQFELKGQENLISPLTAEISSTTFYSTADLVDPVTLGSQIYFLDKQRLYIYLNQDSRQFNTAVDLSGTVRDFLPANYQDVTVAVSQNYIISVDEDNKNDLYIYCNRFDADRLIQSAFWRYRLSSTDSIYGIKVWDNYLYAVSLRNTGVSSGWYLMNNLLEQEELTVPRMDSRSILEVNTENTTASGIQSIITVPYALPSDEDIYVVLTSDFGEDLQYSVFKTNAVKPLVSTTLIFVNGIDLTEHVGKKIYIGTAFRMGIELSQQFIRTQDNNIIEGMLNLRTMHVRHNNTGTYSVEVTRRGRNNKLVSEFSATNTETLESVQKDGLFVAKVFGFSDETKIEIVNDKVTPCNITQIELRGTFNRNSSSLR